MRDHTLTCTQCNRTFVWTAQQQSEYRAQGWDAPKRCPRCRKLKRDFTNARVSRHTGWRPNPYKLSSQLIVVGVILAATVFLFFMGLRFVWAFLGATNVIVFVAFGYDKFAAKALPNLRIPEDVLILASLALAMPGAELGRRIFHHKTRDEEFKRKYFGWMLVEYAVLLVLLAVSAPHVLGWLGF